MDFPSEEDLDAVAAEDEVREKTRPKLNSVDSDFEDHPGDGPHGAFMIWLAVIGIVILLLVVRFW